MPAGRFQWLELSLSCDQSVPMPVKSFVADLSDSESGAEGVMPETVPKKRSMWETWYCVVLLLLLPLCSHMSDSLLRRW